MPLMQRLLRERVGSQEPSAPYDRWSSGFSLKSESVSLKAELQRSSSISHMANNFGTLAVTSVARA